MAKKLNEQRESELHHYAEADAIMVEKGILSRDESNMSMPIALLKAEQETKGRLLEKFEDFPFTKAPTVN